MTPDNPDDMTPDEIQAERLVDEALSTMRIPAWLLPTIRATLTVELLVTEAGQRLLRRARPDPELTTSDVVDVRTGADGRAAADHAAGHAASPARTRRGKRQ